jgi:RNA polymerase sigma-70 factor (ECF subfamily)
VKETTLELVRRAQRGDHDAFDELVGRFGPELYRLAVAVIGPVAAADVTQDTLLLAWRELPTLRDPARFPGWIRRILVNRCRDLARMEHRGVRPLRLDALEADGRPPTVPDPTSGIDRTSDLNAALGRVRVEHRSVLALHYLLDLSIHEVAATLAIPEGTAKSRLNAALVALRRALADGDR